MKNILLLFSLLIMLSYSSCRKHADSSILTKQDYPVAVGDKWVYLMDGAFITDTVTISVVSKITYPDDSVVYYTRSYAKGLVVDSGYIISSPNSFSYSMDSGPYNLFGNLHLTFPMPVDVKVQGQNNTDILTLDTFGISDKFYDKAYSNLYVVHRVETSPWQIIQTVEIKPGVGVVQEALWQSIPGFIYYSQNVYLLSYELH